MLLISDIQSLSMEDANLLLSNEVGDETDDEERLKGKYENHFSDKKDREKSDKNELNDNLENDELSENSSNSISLKNNNDEQDKNLVQYKKKVKVKKKKDKIFDLEREDTKHQLPNTALNLAELQMIGNVTSSLQSST